MKQAANQAVFSTTHSHGTLVLTKDQKIQFHGEHVELEGQFEFALPHEVHVPAKARFHGITGPYNFSGTVGDKGIELKFEGAPGVGNGTITAGSVGFQPAKIRGAANVTLKFI